MLLENKNAVICGAGGHIGTTVARAFAREGAKVFLAGRTPSKLEALVEEIVVARGAAGAAQVDALEPQAIERHLDTIVKKAGSIDVSFNAIWISGLEIIVASRANGVTFSLAPTLAFTRSICTT